MSTPVDRSDLVPVANMRGEDDEETEMLRASFAEATAYLKGFKWFKRLRKAFLGLGVGGVVSVFLMDVDASEGVDETLWVVVGDLPSAYLVVDRAPTAAQALRVYCELMEDWAKAVRSGHGLELVFPVATDATAANAAALDARIRFLREELLPLFEG
ncbi:MAG: hypothetical protein QM765_10090 [Myxococcales bacterium]